MKKDREILKRLKRRVVSARGSVYFEFAYIAPLAVMLVLFAADFCNILHIEQQLEISSRLLADLEIHYEQKSENQDDQNPCTKCKRAVRDYLAEVLPLESPNYVFCNTKVKEVPGILSPLRTALEWTKTEDGDSWAMKILKSLLRGVMNVLSGGSHKYIEDFCKCDEMVGATVSVKTKSFFPKVQGWFGAYFAGVSTQKDFLAISSFEEELKDDGSYKSPRKRVVHRYWMPLLNTLCVPRKTFIRDFETNIDGSVVAKIIKKLNGDIKDYKKKHTK